MLALKSLALLAASLATAANLAAGACDSGRLARCQQEIARDLQTASLAGIQATSGSYSASSQYLAPLSGPPYSPKQQFFREQQRELSGQSLCRLIRSNLDCVLATTPNCYEQGLQSAHNTNLILRAKRFLEQAGCNQPDSSWQTSSCYRSAEVSRCEERYGFSGNLYSNSVFADAAGAANLTACLAYTAFRYCVDSHLRLSCKVHEMDMLNEYLIDRASDLAWRCPTNTSSSLLSAHHAVGLSPPGYYSNAYDQQRVIPSYVGSSNGLNLLSPSREQAWERFRNPADLSSGYGLSRLPGSVSTGEVFDRLVAGNSFDADTSDCPVRAAPFARECEDTLIEQQRLARDSRDGRELQRRICCSLFQYRDCISRVVLDRCADSSPTAVEILMGVRRREMTLTCRNFNRDICSGALRQALTSLPSLLLAAIVGSFIALKQNFRQTIL